MIAKYEIGERVKFPGIGTGYVLAIRTYNGRTLYLVGFKDSPPHLCEEWELQK